MDKINFRKVKESDWNEMYEFLKKTWGGHDYIPEIWEKWLIEKESEFILGEIEGVIAGCVRLNILSPGEIWLEGLRVQDKFQGMGLAWKFQEEILRRAYLYNPRVLRFSTADENKASIHIAEEVGFGEIERYHPLFVDGNNIEEMDDSSIMKSATFDESLKLIEGIFNKERRIGNYLSEGWVFFEISKYNMRNNLQDNIVFYRGSIENPTDVISYSRCEKYGELNINIAYSISGDFASLIGGSLKQLSDDTKKGGIFYCCSNDEYIPLLKEVGFDKRYGDFSVVLMEKRLK